MGKVNVVQFVPFLSSAFQELQKTKQSKTTSDFSVVDEGAIVDV